jgi:hypothetical protein
MTSNDDFERAWLAKLANGLTETAGEETRRAVMAGSETLSENSSRGEVIAWTRSALQRMEARLTETQRRTVMLGCACQYPKTDLAPIKSAYAQSACLPHAHALLQDQFISFLRDTLQLDETLISYIIQRGWGAAGVLQGETIIAAKIPKSNNLIAYVQESDPAKKRALYCHCPRIRAVLQTGESLPALYCYCGAGFYKGIWEEVLQRPVQVTVLESILQGGDVCRFAIETASA